jgi:pseudaminic acid synthase
MNNNFEINNRIIGDGHKCYIIAELSANHGGNEKKAFQLLRFAKKIGADCVKIQTYTADTLTINSNKKYFQIDAGLWKGQNLYSLYQNAFTPWEWQESIKEEADKIGIDFLSTAYDKSSVDFLDEIGVSAFKIASFELIDIPLIKYIASKGKPIIISTGMGTLGEIEEAVSAIRSCGNNKICLLKCSSAYPAKPEDMNYKTIQHLKNTFNLPVGISDHSLGSISAVVGVTLGANIVEKHLCIDRKIKTPDSDFSMEPEEFRKMIQDIRITEKIKGEIEYGVKENEKLSYLNRKSIFIVKDIKKGEIFTKENVRVIRPGYGLKPKYIEVILGKKSRKNIEIGTPFRWEMIE